MRIEVIGAGSIGIVLSSLLRRKNDVTLVVKKGEGNLYDRDFTVKEGEREEKFKVRIAESTGAPDLTIVAVKSYDLDDVFDRYDIRGKVMLIQNGLSHISLEKPGITKIYAVTTWGAKRESRGVVELTGRGYFRVGSESGKVDISFLREAGINAEWVENIKEELYRKAAINAVINPLTALFGVKNGELVENKNLWSLAKEVIGELDELFSRLGYDLQIEKNVLETCKVTGGNVSSMLQDVRNGKKSEIDSITGEIISLGNKNGIRMRLNEFLYGSIKFLESVALHT